MTERVSFRALGADVEWTDAYAGTVARSQVADGSGRLADLVDWLAAAQGTPSPTQPARPRVVVFGDHVTDACRWLADTTDVAVRTVAVLEDVEDGLAAGVALADAEVDAGTDLLVVSGPDLNGAAAALAGLVTGAEPVSLLPRGAAAVDTRDWIERAGHLLAVRRRIAALRESREELLVALDDPALAQATGLILRAVGRRTPVILDGALALGAALLCSDAAPRSGRWWRVADSSDDPVHRRIVAEFAQEPVLDLGTSRIDGTAGILAVGVVRAVIALVPGGIPTDQQTTGPADESKEPTDPSAPEQP